MTTTPSVSLTAGGTAALTVTVSSSPGYTGTVTPTISSALPAGVTASVDAEQRRAGRVSMMFQSPILLNWRDAFANVTLAADLARPHFDRQAINERAMELLQTVGLKDFVRKFPYELSGGMQKRVALERKSVDGILHEVTGRPADVDLLKRHDICRACGEVKGGIDPAGAGVSGRASTPRRSLRAMRLRRLIAAHSRGARGGTTRVS